MKVRTVVAAAIFCLAVFSFAYGQETEKNPYVAQAEKLTAAEKQSFYEILPVEKQETSANKTQDQPATVYVRPTKKERFNRFVKGTVGIKTLARSAASAGVSTITNNPEEWEKTGEGFARRFASNVGTNAIKQTVIYGLDEALEVDSKYYKSEKKDFGSRAKNALLSTVTARNKNGKRVIGIPRLAGTYSSKIIAREVWFPDRFNYKDGLRSGTISLGFSAAFNLLGEYF